MKPERSSRVTRQSSENRQSRSLSERSRRSLSSNEHTSVIARKRKRDFEDPNPVKKSNRIDILLQIPRKVVGNKRYDAFCWMCHKPAEDFYCPHCTRVYHDGCLKKMRKCTEDCECQLTSINGLKAAFSTPSEIKEVVFSALHNVIGEKKNKKNDVQKFSRLFKISPDAQANELLCHTMDIQVIIDGIHMSLYKSTGQFYQDAKWIYHNCFIIYGSDHEMTTTAQKFEKSIKQQLDDAEACGECYREKCTDYLHIDFFTKVCTNPHPIVWAKLKGFPFWPAKCLRIVNGHADVRFFGTHDKSLVPISQVYKISRNNPSGNPKKPRNSTRMSTYEEAMTELSIYVTKYTNKFGNFEYATNKVPLESEKISSTKKAQKKKLCQQDASVAADVNDQNESRTDAEQGSLHLDISSLNDLADVKFSSRENTEMVRFLMEFTADEENPADLQTDRVIQATSESTPQLSLISEQFSVASVNDPSNMCVNILSNGILLNDTEIAQVNSESDINTNACIPVPGTCSTSTPCVITSTQSLNNISSNSACENFTSNVIDNGVSSFNHSNLLKKPYVQTMTPTMVENDPDIQVILENRRKTLIAGVTENKPMTKTFCELLLSNRPHIRDYISSFQQLALRFYLMMFLETHSRTLEYNECEMFHTYYEKVCKAIEEYKSQVITLQKENADLKKKLANQVSHEERKNAIKNEIIQAQCKKSVEEVNILRKEVKDLSHNLTEARRSMISIQEMNNLLLSQKKEIEFLLKQNQEKLADKEKTVQDLETKLLCQKRDVKHTCMQTADNLEEFSKEKFDSNNLVPIHDPNKPIYNVKPNSSIMTEESSKTVKSSTTVFMKASNHPIPFNYPLKKHEQNSVQCSMANESNVQAEREMETESVGFRSSKSSKHIRKHNSTEGRCKFESSAKKRK